MREPNRERKGEIKAINAIQLNEEQKEAMSLIVNNQIVIVTGRAGCLGLGTEVLMFNGTYKKVEDVVVGDQLMGIDSLPRNVLELKRGVEQMYWIRQKRADDYRVNESHILSLKRVRPAIYPRITVNKKRKIDYSTNPLHPKRVTVENISVSDYLKVKRKKQYMGYISPCLQFDNKELLIDPYYLGLWLGDGNRRDIKQITTTDTEIIDYFNSLGCDVFTKKHDSIAYYFKENCIKLNDEFNKIYNLNNIATLLEKYIPSDYLLNSKENRLKLLAGLLDSDGHYITVGKYYEIIQKNKHISEQIAFLSRSLGYKTNIRSKKATMKRKDGSVYKCEVYRISITPTDIVPVKIKRKKNKIGSDFKNRSHSGITIEKDIVDNYYGFTLDGDNLFLLKDLTVTHNSGKSLVCAKAGLDFLKKKQIDCLWNTRAAIEVGKSIGLLPGHLHEKFDPYMEAFIENLNKCCTDKREIAALIEAEKIKALPIQFIRGKTVEDVLIVEEAQNTTKAEMLAILTRLGKTGKIIINGDNEQTDIRTPDGQMNGLTYAIQLSRKIEEVKYIKLKENHRSDLVGKILDLEYN
jgi:hypothetical protein